MVQGTAGQVSIDAHTVFVIGKVAETRKYLSTNPKWYSKCKICFGFMFDFDEK